MSRGCRGRRSRTIPGGLAPARTAPELLEMYFLDARMHLLEAAAILDRIGRAPGGPAAARDSRVRKLVAGARLLADGKSDRAERFQILFSGD